jgi:cell division protein FtsB
LKLLVAALAVLLIALQARLWLGDGSIPGVWQLREAVAAQAAENRRLQARNDALLADVRDLKTGLAAVEERARRELGMIGEDEVFYQVVEVQAER